MDRDFNKLMGSNTSQNPQPQDQNQGANTNPTQDLSSLSGEAAGQLPQGNPGVTNESQDTMPDNSGQEQGVEQEPSYNDVDLDNLLSGFGDESQEDPNEEATETSDQEIQENTQEGDGSSDQDIQEIDQMLQDILGMDTTQEQSNLDEAIQSGDIEKIKQENDIFRSTLAEKDGKIKDLEKRFEMLTSEFEKNLDKQMMGDYENQSKFRLLNTIDDDDGLKAIVAYKYKSDTDPQYKDKLVDAVKDYLQDIAGVNIDDIMGQQRVDEKSGMGYGGNDYSSPNPSDQSNPLLDMFE